MTTLSASARDRAAERDPVCGVRVDATSAVAFEEYAGGIYHFCSDKCHERFTASPDLYANRPNGPR
jgi:Cu+-exporting ATPase